MEPQTTDVYVKLHKCTDFSLDIFLINSVILYGQFY